MLVVTDIAKLCGAGESGEVVQRQWTHNFVAVLLLFVLVTGWAVGRPKPCSTNGQGMVVWIDEASIAVQSDMVGWCFRCWCGENKVIIIGGAMSDVCNNLVCGEV